MKLKCLLHGHRYGLAKNKSRWTPNEFDIDGEYIRTCTKRCIKCNKEKKFVQYGMSHREIIRIQSEWIIT